MIEKQWHKKKGKIKQVYLSQVQRSKEYGRPAPTYTRDELVDWCMSQKEYHELFETWKVSGFKKDLAPSIDRLDDYAGYSLSNIRLCSWYENNTKANKDRKEGRNNKHSKAVIQMDENMNEIASYHSTIEAERQTGIPNTNISSVCRGKRSTAGGYYWKHKEN